MSLEFARLDMSKPSDSHGNCHEKGIARGRAARSRRAVLWPEKGSWASAVLPDAGGVSRQCTEVKAMAVSGSIARATLL